MSTVEHKHLSVHAIHRFFSGAQLDAQTATPTYEMLKYIFRHFRLSLRWFVEEDGLCYTGHWHICIGTAGDSPKFASQDDALAWCHSALNNYCASISRSLEVAK